MTMAIGSFPALPREGQGQEVSGSCLSVHSFSPTRQGSREGGSLAPRTEPGSWVPLSFLKVPLHLGRETEQGIGVGEGDK